MANQLLLGRALDQNGYVAAGAKATVYLTGTSTLIDVWTTADASIAAANPIIADGNGYWPQRFVTETAKVVITDADDVALQTLDPAPVSLGTGSAATEVSYAPSVELPFTNVQDAIQGLAVRAPSGRNKIINGQGRVNQRGYVSGTATGGANQYTLDRWRVVTSGQSLTFTGNDAGRTMTAPAGGCEQVVEGANIEGGTYVINWTGTATCTVDGITRAKGATFTLTANTNATVRMIGGTFTDVQLELGTVAAPFQHLPLGDELARCQRYYLSAVTGGAFALVRATNFNAGSFATVGGFQFPVTMRISPAMTYTWEVNDVLQGGAMTTFQANSWGLVFSTSIAGSAYIDLITLTADAEI